LRTTSIDQVITSTAIGEKGTLEPCPEDGFWWINPENMVTIEDIAALDRYQYSENFIYHNPARRSN